MERYLDTLFQESVQSKALPALGAIVYNTSGNLLYENAFGTTCSDDPQASPFAADTQLAMQSAGKIVTAISALQLLEQGKFKLDDPVEKFCPEIAQLPVLVGFNDDGSPMTRPPKSKPLMQHLLTHTAGFPYHFWHSLAHRYMNTPERAGRILSPRETYSYPLTADPGAAYQYGIHMEWLGWVVEAITGVPFREYVRDHITRPLGLTLTGGYPDPARPFLTMNLRTPDDQLVPMPALTAMDPHAELGGGGTNFFSTLHEYAQLLLTVLNNGTHPVSMVRLLRPETVQRYMFTDALAWLDSPRPDLSRLNVFEDSVMPGFSRAGHFLPQGTVAGWSCGNFILNTQDDLTLEVTGATGKKMLPGRRKGSAAWAGLGNYYYWIDREAGRTGLIAAGLIPFMDPEVRRLFAELEGAVYKDLGDT